LIVYSKSPIVKLSRHSVAKQARHVTVTRQHTHTVFVYTGLYYGISESQVGHFTLLVTYLVFCVGNGLADQWKYRTQWPFKCKHSVYSGFSATL